MHKLWAVPVVMLASSAFGDFITPDDYGWAREDSQSAYFEWDYFTSASGGNDPDVGQFPGELPGDWVAPDVVETTGNGFVTGSGNIYSPFGPINVRATIPNYDSGEGRTTLLVQVRTIGNELDYAGVTAEGEAPAEIIEVYREELTDLGWLVETLFVFEFEGNAGVYTLDMPAIDPHVSFDALAADTFNESSCYADFNGDGRIDTQDFIAYLNAWSAGDSSADANGDGRVNTQDFISFLNLWSAGC